MTLKSACPEHDARSLDGRVADPADFSCSGRRRRMSAGTSGFGCGQERRRHEADQRFQARRWRGAALRWAARPSGLCRAVTSGANLRLRGLHRRLTRFTGRTRGFPAGKVREACQSKRATPEGTPTLTCGQVPMSFTLLNTVTSCGRLGSAGHARSSGRRRPL